MYNFILLICITITLADLMLQFPKMKEATGFEVVLEEGDVLYIPSFWMHYIVGLEKNLQCNTRSGMLPNDPWSGKVQPCLAR